MQKLKIPPFTFLVDDDGAVRFQNTDNPAWTVWMPRAVWEQALPWLIAASNSVKGKAPATAIDFVGD